MSTVQTEKWRSIYKSAHFVHIAELYSGEKFTDIKFMLMCQILEILYFFQHGKNSNSFANKIEELFLDVYKKPLNSETANVLRILRNHVAHTGTLVIIDKVLSEEDTRSLSDFQKIHKETLTATAFSFNLLVGNILMICLGLGDDDLFRNGNPPQFMTIFREAK